MQLALLRVAECFILFSCLGLIVYCSKTRMRTNVTCQVLEFVDVEICTGSKRHIRFSLKEIIQIPNQMTSKQLHNSNIVPISS